MATLSIDVNSRRKSHSPHSAWVIPMMRTSAPVAQRDIHGCDRATSSAGSMPAWIASTLKTETSISGVIPTPS